MRTQLPKNGHNSPLLFGPCLLWPNGWMDQDTTWYGGTACPGDIVLDGDVAPDPPKGGTAAPSTFRPISIAAKRSPISGTAELLLLLLLLLLQQLHWLPLRPRVEFKFAVLVCKAHNNLAPPLWQYDCVGWYVVYYYADVYIWYCFT